MEILKYAAHVYDISSEQVIISHFWSLGIRISVPNNKNQIQRIGHVLLCTVHTHTFHFLVEFLIKAKRLKREVQECDDRIFLTLIQTQIHSQYSRAGYKTNENRCHKWDSLHFNGDNRLHNEVWTRHDRHPAYNKSACMNLISADSINGVWF